MLIFVAGVHGVGKGYLCDSYISNNNMLHKSASQLIKENSDVVLTDNKLTSDVERNQLILISALEELKAQNKSVLLDGHFALVSKDGEIKKLPSSVFKSMKLDAVILIENDKKTITERVIKRDKIAPLYDVDKLLFIEAENADLICKELGMPLIKLMAPTLADFERTIEEIECRIKSGTL